MPLPTLTPEQRDAALDKARESRQRRAAALDELAHGRTNLAEFLTAADGDPVLAKTKVTTTLRNVRGIGPNKTSQLMRRVGIADSRRLAGLGERQRRELIAACDR
jgi:predicted flap endonuclease-1-like 5' DNA nuclease